MISKMALLSRVTSKLMLILLYISFIYLIFYKEQLKACAFKKIVYKWLLSPIPGFKEHIMDFSQIYVTFHILSTNS